MRGVLGQATALWRVTWLYVAISERVGTEMNEGMISLALVSCGGYTFGKLRFDELYKQSGGQGTGGHW